MSTSAGFRELFRQKSRLALSLGLLLAACTTGSSKVDGDLSSYTVSPVRNVLAITRDDRVTWNGKSVSDAQLAALMALAKAIPEEPELHFQPEPQASYDRSLRVLQIIKKSGVTKFGFIGNEMYVEEKPAP